MDYKYFTLSELNSIHNGNAIKLTLLLKDYKHSVSNQNIIDKKIF